MAKVKEKKPQKETKQKATEKEAKRSAEAETCARTCGKFSLCSPHGMSTTRSSTGLGFKAFLGFLSGVVVFTAAVLHAPLGLFSKES